MTKPLAQAGYKIIDTSVDSIDIAEDRRRFNELFKNLEIPRLPGETVFSVEEAVKVANEIGFPVLVRPSYVLGGRAMEIVYNEKELMEYMASAVRVTPEHPVLVDKYLMGQELEVDAVSDGETVLIPAILEVNPRSSCTVPFLSKVTGIPMVKLATKCALGKKLKDLGHRDGLASER